MRQIDPEAVPGKRREQRGPRLFCPDPPAQLLEEQVDGGTLCRNIPRQILRQRFIGTSGCPRCIDDRCRGEHGTHKADQIAGKSFPARQHVLLPIPAQQIVPRKAERIEKLHFIQRSRNKYADPRELRQRRKQQLKHEPQQQKIAALLFIRRDRAQQRCRQIKAHDGKEEPHMIFACKKLYDDPFPVLGQVICPDNVDSRVYA